MVGNWDTFLHQVEQWTREMERFMAHVDEARAANLSSMVLAPTTAGLWRPADVNVYETADTVVVQAELAGIASEDMTIQYESGRLLVWGQRRELITAEAQSIPAAWRSSRVDSLSEYNFRRLSTLKQPKQPCLQGFCRFTSPSDQDHRNGIIQLSLGEGERRSR